MFKFFRNKNSNDSSNKINIKNKMIAKIQLKIEKINSIFKIKCV